MFYAICDPVTKKEKLGFTGHTEEVSCGGGRLASTWGRGRACYVRKRAPEVKRNAQEEMLTICSERLHPLLQLACVHYILESFFFSLIEGIFRSFPVYFQLLARPRHICDI